MKKSNLLSSDGNERDEMPQPKFDIASDGHIETNDEELGQRRYVKAHDREESTMQHPDFKIVSNHIPKSLGELVGLFDVQIGAVTVKGIWVWRTEHGRLRVFWPSRRLSGESRRYSEIVEVDLDLLTEINAAILAHYHARKRAEDAAKKAGRDAERARKKTDHNRVAALDKTETEEQSK